jgi:hypothetical protein
MQWLQDSNHSNVDNINNVRYEARGHVRNKKTEYLKPKLVNLKLTVRPRISETCIGVSLTVRRVTRLELIQ